VLSGKRGYLLPRAREAARRKAAGLVWHDRLNDQAIAATCGISRRTLSYWKHQADFQALVAAERDAWLVATGRVPISSADSAATTVQRQPAIEGW